MAIWLKLKALIGWPLKAQALNRTRPKLASGMTSPSSLVGASAMTSADASAGWLLIVCAVWNDSPLV